MCRSGGAVLACPSQSAIVQYLTPFACFPLSCGCYNPVRGGSLLIKTPKISTIDDEAKGKLRGVQDFGGGCLCWTRTRSRGISGLHHLGREVYTFVGTGYVELMQHATAAVLFPFVFSLFSWCCVSEIERTPRIHSFRQWHETVSLKLMPEAGWRRFTLMILLDA